MGDMRLHELADECRIEGLSAVYAAKVGKKDGPQNFAALMAYAHDCFAVEDALRARANQGDQA